MPHASSVPSSPALSVERVAAATGRYVRYIVTGAAGAAQFSIPVTMDGPNTVVYCEALYEKLVTCAAPAASLMPAAPQAPPRLALLP